ncbi:MAG: ABC transporter substrate-binding protein [Pseudonocardiaceae bacterium]|nr:ABC transporter substrate-binding protein [Pseudonocardiaceae bacterium]
MIDGPGPWGSGVFELVEGYSSLRAEIGLVSADPFVATWLPTDQPRSDRIVLAANPNHWNRDRGPNLDQVVFRNDLDPAEALDLVCNSEGEVDIVTEVAPTDAQQVLKSQHARLVLVDALRVLTCLINRDAEGVPLGDVRARRALNLAVNRDELIQQTFAGYAHPLSGLTAPYQAGVPNGQRPYPHDPAAARELFHDAGWPSGRELRLATLPDMEGVARVLVEHYQRALGVEVSLTVIAADRVLAAQHALVEKTLPLPFDLLVFPWFDLLADAPPAVMHREFYHSTGAFRTGPTVPEFEDLMGKFATSIDESLVGYATEIDKLVYDQALSVFLCAPQALYAVNNNVTGFEGYAATFELAETGVNDRHWSRR